MSISSKLFVMASGESNVYGTWYYWNFRTSSFKQVACLILHDEHTNYPIIRLSYLLTSPYINIVWLNSINMSTICAQVIWIFFLKIAWRMLCRCFDIFKCWLNSYRVICVILNVSCSLNYYLRFHYLSSFAKARHKSVLCTLTAIEM